MNVNEACQILGVEPTADDQTLRDAHRRKIRLAHPDVGGSAAAAARLNEALAVLRSTDLSARPDLPAAGVSSVPAPSPTRPADVDDYFVVDVAPDDLLSRLAEAGHEVGEVVFVDPHVGMLEIVVGDAPGVGQLAVTVGGPVAGGTEVSFTLEPLGITPAPPIGPVVTALMAAIRR